MRTILLDMNGVRIKEAKEYLQSFGQDMAAAGFRTFAKNCKIAGLSLVLLSHDISEQSEDCLLYTSRP